MTISNRHLLHHFTPSIDPISCFKQINLLTEIELDEAEDGELSDISEHDKNYTSKLTFQILFASHFSMQAAVVLKPELYTALYKDIYRWFSFCLRRALAAANVNSDSHSG